MRNPNIRLIYEITVARPFIYHPPAEPPVLLFEDAHIIIADKPSGLLSVPGKSVDHKDCLESRLRAIYAELRLIHRLDLATSGVMVFARTAEAQRHIGLQFEKRYTEKTYVARVANSMRGDSGRINLPLITDWPNRPKQHVNFERGKPSITDWEVTEREETATRLHLYPKTGRSHQLRVHMLAIGHPILGDQLYADDIAFAAANRLQLHAYKLRLRHPKGGRWMEFIAPCPF